MLNLKSPLACVWEITNRCNFKCPHCRAYMDSPEEDSNLEKKIINQIIETKILSVNLSGGEPLLNPRLFDIVSNLTDNMVDVGISTNGYLYSEYANDLKKSGISFVQISLDGPKNIHDKFRGISGAYDKAIESMKTAKRMDHFVQMNTTITSQNMEFIFDNINLAEQIGIDRIFFRRVVASGLAESNKMLIPDKLKYHELLKKLLDIKYSSNTNVQISIDDPIVSLFDVNRYSNDVICCSAGITSLGIDSYGNVYPCIFARKILGNLNDISMKEIWNNSEVLERLRNRDIEICGECKNKFSCGGCRGANGIFKHDFMCPLN